MTHELKELCAVSDKPCQGICRETRVIKRGKDPESCPCWYIEKTKVRPRKAVEIRIKKGVNNG